MAHPNDPTAFRSRWKTRTAWEASELFAYLLKTYPDRCRECAFHPKTQGHRWDCPLVPR